MRRTATIGIALALALGLAGCEATFDETFVVDELSILAVQTAVHAGSDQEQAELVFVPEVLRSMPQLPALPRIEVRALAVHPEDQGGQDAITHFHWAVGDPPLEDLPTVVTTQPVLQIEEGTVVPALAALLPDGGDLTPTGLADLLDEGPIHVPLVVTAFAGQETARAVKLLTIRGLVGAEDEANRNPSAEGLSMDDVEWSEDLLENIGRGPVGPYDLQRDEQVVFEVDPDDPGADDGDVETTMYVTAGTIGWSPESTRTWVQRVPGEDYAPEQMRAFLVLRDLQGGQSWLTIQQRLVP